MSLALNSTAFSAALSAIQANKAKWDQVTSALALVADVDGVVAQHTAKLQNLSGAVKFIRRYATKASFQSAAQNFDYTSYLTQGYTPAYLIDEGKTLAIAVDMLNPLYTGMPDFHVGDVGFEYSAQESLDSAAIATLVAGAVAPLATKSELTTAVAPLATKDEVTVVIANSATKTELSNAVTPLATTALVQTVNDTLTGQVASLALNSATKTQLNDAVAPLATTMALTMAQASLSGQIDDVNVVVQDHGVAIGQLQQITGVVTE